MPYHRPGQPSANDRPDDHLVSWGQLKSFPFMGPSLNTPIGHGSACKGAATIRWVRWRMGVAFAVLLLTWALICGFVLLSLALGWRL